MKKILFSGYYGFENSGDDAFLEVCAWGAKKYWGTTNNTFLTSNLPLLKNSAKSLTPYRIKGSTHAQVIAHSINADYFISAGGSTFSKHTEYSLRDVALKTRNILNKSMRVGAIGVSIGPFKSLSDEQNIVKYLKKMNFLSLRDKASYEYAKSLSLPYEPIEAFDLAALLPKVYSYKKNNDRKTDNKKIIGVSVCNYERYVGGNLDAEKSRNEYLLKLIANLPNEAGYIFRFFVFNGNSRVGDEEITNYFVSKLPKRNIQIIPYLNNVEATWKAIAECDLVISTRLHASIFACYADVPFFLMEYHRKCTDFLNDVGQPKCYRLNNELNDISKIVDEIEMILKTGIYKKAEHIESTKALATNNFSKVII